MKKREPVVWHALVSAFIAVAAYFGFDLVGLEEFFLPLMPLLQALAFMPARAKVTPVQHAVKGSHPDDVERGFV